ncbi:MAG: vitamin B12 dependent-methionine synthase activation domain-containing protein [Bacteroides sp.]|nr:vitamin B12 dependent-methionine synthase activation domain-containing protein [Bacteroides sp.]
MIVNYTVHDTAPYINWLYFFHAWGFQPKFSSIARLHGCDSCRVMWLTSFAEADRPKASEAMQLFKEAQRMLAELDSQYSIKGLVELLPAVSDGDDLLITALDGSILTFPFLRQQTVKKEDEPYVCLADFVRPKEKQQPDTLGVFATTTNIDVEAVAQDDPYKTMLVQTLADRLAEAGTERMHEQVRKELWAYAPNESLSLEELLEEKYQGIRPAVGYPSMPDQSVNFLIDELLDMKRIGISLTENGMMMPHASVSGLMFAHPRAEYFNIGKIGNDQLEDYARRRGMPVETMRKFLAGNL